MSEYLLITGLSGAGRSTAAAALEDAGWYVIDNMPPSLLSQAAEIVGRPGSVHDRVALVVGRGGSDLVLETLPAVEKLRASGHRVRIIYLDAPDHVLVRRFEGTRRRHPISATQVEEAIADERQLLRPIRDHADLVVDTGELNVHQLRARVTEAFADQADAGMQTSVVSFGYKHGVPLDADLVIDCRFLPNPYWEEELRPLSGLDAPVADFVLQRTETAAFLERLDALLQLVVPGYEAEGKSYLTIALGCTGGRHRSVALAEEVARRLRGMEVPTGVLHRDIDR